LLNIDGHRYNARHTIGLASTIVNTPWKPNGSAGDRMCHMSADSDDLVQVYATGSVTDGYLVKGRLEAEGIPVLMKGEGDGPYRVGPAYLWVQSSLEVQARLILESLESTADSPDRQELGEG
jgi:hypothetical protein